MIIKKRIAIFASGSGSNAENLINYFNKENSDVNVTVVLTNNAAAGVLERAEKNKVHSVIFDKHTFRNTSKIVEFLQEENIDLVVLAGFLWLIPGNLVKAFPNRIINIHPALLPKYGGKGMYGMNVHEAVINNKEKESGITIHYVNEVYDEGTPILQSTCQVEEGDTPELLAQKIHQLEYKHLPVVVEQLLNEQN